MNGVFVGLLAGVVIMVAAMLLASVRNVVDVGIARRRLYGTRARRWLSLSSSVMADHSIRSDWVMLAPAWPIIGLLTVLAFALSGVGLALITAVGTTVVVVTMRQAVRKRSRESYERLLPHALDAMARSLRSGAGFVAALDEASLSQPGPVGADLRHVTREIGLGVGIAEALRHWSERRDGPSVRLCVAAMTLAHNTGGTQAFAIDAVAATVRQQLRAAAVARMHATQSRASATALTVLPFLVTAPTLMVNQDARLFMLHHPVGLCILAAGIALDVLGALWMAHLVNRVLT